MTRLNWTFWDILGSFTTFYDILGHFGTIWKKVGWIWLNHPFSPIIGSFINKIVYMTYVARRLVSARSFSCKFGSSEKTRFGSTDMDGRTDWRTDGRTERRTERQKYGPTDQQTDTPSYRVVLAFYRVVLATKNALQTHGPMGPRHGRMDRWTDGLLWYSWTHQQI